MYMFSCCLFVCLSVYLPNTETKSLFIIPLELIISWFYFVFYCVKRIGECEQNHDATSTQDNTLKRNETQFPKHA